MRPYYKGVRFKLSLSAILLCLIAVAQDRPDPDPSQLNPWKPSEIAAPAKMAAELKSADSSRHVIYVGFPILYKGAHIPGARFAGPCSKEEGLGLLKNELKDVPHDAEVVVYCGCCPFGRCPNIRPAYKALAQMGYTKIKVLELDTNLHTDWVAKGYPIEQSGK
jgi:thiosulfate/3-mercaptopyruvate sulfurtransferase